MQNGVLLGYIGLISFMIETIKQTVGQSYKVLSTGGLVNVLRDKLPQLDYINQNLTLEGLALIPDLIQNKV
jgi:type III pantothenate kinase